MMLPLDGWQSLLLPLRASGLYLAQWSVIGEGFTTPYWELVDESRFGSGFYRPLGAATLGTLWQLGDGSPRAFHWFSILLHSACAALVTSLALALGWQRGLAIGAGLLFAVHGSHAEPVAWISGIPELLATFFCLLSLRSLARFQPLRCGLFLLAAMLSKEVAIGVWLLALAITVLRPKPDLQPEIAHQATSGSTPPAQRRWLTFTSLVVAAAIVYFLRFSAFDSAASGFDRVNTFHALDQGQQVSLSFSLIARYWGFLIWPWPHMPFRPLALGEAADTTRLWLGIVGAVLSLGALVWWFRNRQNRTVLFGLGLLFAGLIPVLNTKALGQYPFEERFLYLPSAGFALVVVALLSRLPKPTWAWAGLLILAIPNAYSAHSGAQHWKTEEALFRWAREMAPNAMTGHIEYGRLMLEQAQNETDRLKRTRLTEYALEAYQESLDVDPDHYFVTAVEREKGNLGLGDALYLDGDFSGAETVYQRVVDHYKFSPIGYLGLANCRAQTAMTHGEAGHYELADRVMAEALGFFDTALEQDPNLDAAMLGKTTALFQLGRFDDALQLATGMFSKDPTRLEAAQLLFSLQVELGQVELAIRTLDYFLEQAPDHPQRDMVQQTIDELRRMHASNPPR